MTRQLTDNAAASKEPLLVLPQSVLTEGAQEDSCQRRGEPNNAVPARRERIGACPHHWMIEAAMLPLSKGVCRVCGEEKLFRNQLQWSEIAPVRVMNGRRQEKDITIRPDQREAAAFVLAGSRYGSSMPLQSARREY